MNLARWGSWWDSQVQGGGKHLSQAGDHRQLPVQAKIGTMIQKVQKRSALAALVLVIATTVALAVLPANEIMALRRTALNVFVQPGVIVWWLVMAGPNQFSPTTYAGYEAIVVANTGCWLQAMWFMFNVASGAVTRRWYAIAAPVLTMASLAIVVMRESNKMIPSVVRDPLSRFVDPGVTVWWLVLGNLFQGSPSSRSGMAFAALANAGFWTFVFWVLVVAVGFVRRKVSKPRS